MNSLLQTTFETIPVLRQHILGPRRASVLSTKVPLLSVLDKEIMLRQMNDLKDQRASSYLRFVQDIQNFSISRYVMNSELSDVVHRSVNDEVLLHRLDTMRPFEFHEIEIVNDSVAYLVYLVKIKKKRYLSLYDFSRYTNHDRYPNTPLRFSCRIR